MHRAWAAGGRPFEVVAGAPHATFGARVTFRANGDATDLARALDLAPLGWAPAWIGVRVSSAGVRAKGYARASVLPRHELDAFPLWRELGVPLEPWMVAADGERRELYLLSPAELAWERFVAACTSPLGGLDLEHAIRPRARRGAFGVSLRLARGELEEVTLFAGARALPPENELERAWPVGLDDEDAAAYRNALSGVRSLGRLPSGAWHAMLAWSFTVDGRRARAVSLSVPKLD